MIRLREVELVKTIFDPRKLEDPGYPHFAIAGRSNVGKSSLINKVLGRQKLAKISKTPGRTRSINYYLVDKKFIIADLPGYGFAKVSMRERKSWKHLVEKYFTLITDVLAVFLLVDSKRAVEEEEEMILNFLSTFGAQVVVVFTKVDRLTQKERAGLRSRSSEHVVDITGREPIFFSARTGEGKEKIVRAMSEFLSKGRN
ncbi:MAG: YihA family ribosome biogenesis GTP-binding protein [Deltaproteobacteria bacterium]|nr:YihA family ribosome biogenesis GTP-binding protein [Deltaproteobacteria bacterium]NIS76678.1 YihA family ribosome biogenesis GTP-binding protein [Deltaproteobacteria bacterium]